MKRLLTLLLLLPLFAIAQDTHTLPSGTIQFPAGLRFKAVTPDSLNQLWLTNPLTGKANRIFTATESNLLFAPIVGGGYVPTNRTLTIAGVTYDLSANRIWTLATHSVGYGLAGSNYTGASAQAWRVDTSGSTSPASKPYLQAYAYTKNYVNTNFIQNKIAGGTQSGAAIAVDDAISTTGGTISVSKNIASTGVTSSVNIKAGAAGNAATGNIAQLTLQAASDAGGLYNQAVISQQQSGTHSLLTFDAGSLSTNYDMLFKAGTYNIGSVGNYIYHNGNLSTLVSDLSPYYFAATFGSPKSILFRGASAISQNNSDFVYDYTTGRFGLGVGSPSYKMHVSENIGNLAGIQYGSVYVDANYTPTTNDLTSQAKSVEAHFTKLGSSNVQDIYAISGVVVNNGSGTVGGISGYTSAVQNLGTGTVANAYGVHTLGAIASTGHVITDAYGVYIEQQKNAGVTHGHGIYQTGPADDNFIGGPTQVGYGAATRTASFVNIVNDPAAFSVFGATPVLNLGTVSPLGDNVTNQGAVGLNVVVEDNAAVTTGTANNLFGIQISLKQRVARSKGGIDDVAGITIKNDAVGALAAADAYYVGTKYLSSGLTSQEWAGGSFKTDANSGQAFGASGAYGVGLDFVNGSGVSSRNSTFTNAAIRIPNATSFKVRSNSLLTDYIALTTNTSDDLLLGHTGAVKITTGGDVTMQNITAKTSAGFVGIGQTSPAAYLDVAGLNIAGSTNYGVRSTTNYNSSSDLNSSGNYAGYFLNNFNSSGTSNTSTVTGIRTGARNISTGTVSEVRGIYSEAVAGNGTVDQITGLLVWAGNQREGGAAVTGTTNTTYGIRVASLANNVSSGTMTTRYGLRVDNVGTGANFYSAYFGGGKVYTAGNLLIGSTTDDGVNALQVTGSITSSVATASTVATWDASKKLGSTATTGTGSFVRQNIPDFTGGGFNIFSGANNTIFTANGGGNYSINLPALSGTIALTSQLNKLNGYTVATLPAGTVGSIAYVTDALAPTYGATVVGGGAVTAMVFYNGTNWVLQ